MTTTRQSLQKKSKLRMVHLLMSLFLFISVLASSFKHKEEAAAIAKEKFMQQLAGFQQNSRKLTQQIQLLRQEKASLEQVQESFYRAKDSYKQVEYLIEYLDPDLAKKINGAPIPKVLIEEADYQAIPFLPPSFRTFPPESFQLMEELLFAEEMEEESKETLVVLAYSLEEKASIFAGNLSLQPLSDLQILESLREEVIRAITMGISGFDAPAAGREMEYVAASLRPVMATIQLYENTENSEANEHSRKASALLKKAIAYLEQHPDFDTFDRLSFIREFADPAYGAITAFQQQFLPHTIPTSKAVNQQALSIFSPDFLKASYFAKQDREALRPELLELGRMLFFDPVLSGNQQRSCASCHHPDRAFTDGLPRSLAFDFKGTVQRNSPGLLNAVFSNAYFYDSRAQYLQDQVPGVLLKKDELHGSYEEAVEQLQHSREYKKLFKKAFTERVDNPISPNTINRAIAAYVQSLVALNSPFDRYMRHETELLGASAKRGFNLFMGKAGCGTCHFAPIFNGTVPPRYTESETEVLGVPESADFVHAKLDEDLGRAGVIPAEALKHSFKTPTVRNVALSSPYMHNGAFTSLDEVMEFYDLGGGAGLGLEVPNQTLPPNPLELSSQEKKDIIAFMESLSDTTTTFPAPQRLPRFSSQKADLNKRVIGGIY